MRMMKLSLLSLAIAASTISHATFAAEDFGNLISGGKVGIDARYRYEHVDQDNALDNANAQTLRTRLTLQSGKWYGLSALVEADNVSRLGDAAYNSTRNGQTGHSVVADPDGSEINQALLRYDRPTTNEPGFVRASASSRRDPLGRKARRASPVVGGDPLGPATKWPRSHSYHRASETPPSESFRTLSQLTRSYAE
jgi:hypothetical protein